MNRRGFVSSLLALAVVPFLPIRKDAAQKRDARTLTVGPDGDFRSLSDAVAASEAGDTIYVLPATHVVTETIDFGGRRIHAIGSEYRIKSGKYMNFVKVQEGSIFSYNRITSL